MIKREEWVEAALRHVYSDAPNGYMVLPLADDLPLLHDRREYLCAMEQVWAIRESLA